MKKCPFCKADIEDNARFCLYCMKPLAEKKVIASPKEKKRRWPLLVAGVVLLAVLLCLLFAFCVEKEEPEPIQDNGTAATDAEKIPGDTSETVGETPDEVGPSDDTKPVTDSATAPAEDTKPSTEHTTKPSESTNPTEATKPDSSPEPTQCDHNYTLTNLLEPTCTADGFNTYACGKCGDSYQESIAAAGHQYAAATCLLPKTCRVCNHTDGVALGHSFADGRCSRCNAADPDYEKPQSGVVYTYREAQSGDAFNAQYTNDGSDIVITGVDSLSPNGEYDIPSYIDGKRVIAIMPNAFHGIDARKVVVGNTIKVIWQYAFADCINLTDIYFCGSKIDVDTTAFPTTDQRTGTLTIHCSAACHNSNMLSYESAAEYWYDAAYEEWGG